MPISSLRPKTKKNLNRGDVKLSPKIFREYDIRGLADSELVGEKAVLLGRGLASFFQQRGVKKIALGRDCRLSSESLFQSLSESFLGSGIDVVDVGLVPTPGLYFACHHLTVGGGVMITGSHNPAEYNGFKVVCGEATLFGDEIQMVRELVEKKEFVSGKGTYSKTEILDAYCDAIVKSIGRKLSLKIAIDCGNAMGGGVAKRIYEKLGCEVIELFGELDGHFPNHHPDPTQPENLKQLIATVKAEKLQMGIAFDGDADRIGLVDRNGSILFGDEILILYARALLKVSPGAKIISEVKASRKFFADVAAHGGKPIMWKTGHSLIKAKMKEEGALLAGEMSGHMFFKDRYYGFDDAIYAGARAIEIIEASGKSPVELLADLPKTFSTPEIRVDCPDEIKFQVVDEARRAFISKGLEVNPIDGARVEYPEGWGLVRASNTQPVLVYRFEANSAAELNRIRTEIETVLAQILEKRS